MNRQPPPAPSTSARHCTDEKKEDVILNVLTHRVDRYGGVIVDETFFHLHVTPQLTAEHFDALLAKSIDTWLKDSRRGLWVKIPKERAELIPTCVKHGFDFHHAAPGGVMLTRWLPSNEPSKIPEYATHTVGIGGFCLSAKGEVLVVAEKYAEKPLAWKLPGGYVSAGEELADAAVREVMEETKIKSEFCGIISFRHMFPGQHKVSDIYFVALLKPLSFDIVKEDAEIQEARWMKLEQYMNDPNVNTVNKAIAKLVYDNRNDLPAIYIKADTIPPPFKHTQFYTLFSVPKPMK